MAGVGATFKAGEQKALPGVYTRIYNANGNSRHAGQLGVGAAVVQSNWGPVNAAIAVNNDEGDVKKKIGTGKGPDVVAQAFAGGAYVMNVVRAGTGGAAAKLLLKGTDGLADAAELQSKYPTSRTFHVTIRDGLNVAEKEFIAYEDNRQIEKLIFTAGEAEADTFIAEINKSSQYFNAVKPSGANATALGAVLNEALYGGTDPTATGEDYINAFGTLERVPFGGITVDTEDASIHTSLHAFVKRLLTQGTRTMAIVGQRTSVEFYKRKEAAKAFNDFLMVYVANGFTVGEAQIEGALAAGRVLGMMVAQNYKTSLTKKVVQGSTGVHDALSNDEYVESAKNGMLVFGLNADGLAEIVYGINTLISLNDDQDEGWKKIRRVRTRFELIDRIAYALDQQIGSGEGIPNSADGLQHVITVGNGIIADMILEGGLESGTMIIDESNAAHGDAAWFGFEDLVDLDGIEKLYLAFGFQY